MTNEQAFKERVERDRITGKEDYTLPQPWLDAQVKLLKDIPDAYQRILGNFVWLYDSVSGFSGRPYPITRMGDYLHRSMMQRAGGSIYGASV